MSSKNIDCRFEFVIFPSPFCRFESTRLSSTFRADLSSIWHSRMSTKQSRGRRCRRKNHRQFWDFVCRQFYWKTSLTRLLSLNSFQRCILTVNLKSLSALGCVCYNWQDSIPALSMHLEPSHLN